jgi:hypothetical protein
MAACTDRGTMDLDPDTVFCSCGHYDAEHLTVFVGDKQLCHRCADDELTLQPVAGVVKLPEAL